MSCLTTADTPTAAMAENSPAETAREWPFQFATGHIPRTGSKVSCGSACDLRGGDGRTVDGAKRHAYLWRIDGIEPGEIVARFNASQTRQDGPGRDGGAPSRTTPQAVPSLFFGTHFGTQIYQGVRLTFPARPHRRFARFCIEPLPTVASHPNKGACNPYWTRKSCAMPSEPHWWRSEVGA